MNRKEHWRPQVHQKHTEETKLPTCICANCQNVFVQIAKMYLPKSKDTFVKIKERICPNYKMYLCIEHWRPQVHQRHTEETISLFPSLPNAHPSHAYSSHAYSSHAYSSHAYFSRANSSHAYSSHAYSSNANAHAYSAHASSHAYSSCAYSPHIQLFICILITCMHTQTHLLTLNMHTLLITSTPFSHTHHMYTPHILTHHLQTHHILEICVTHTQLQGI